VVLTGRTLIEGSARGPVAALAPLSFWGGFDPETGLVIDRSNPAFGRSLAGAVLVMTASRGSSSSATILAEAIRLGTAPAAIVLAEPDPILLAGAMVAAELYGGVCPVVRVEEAPV
jgi:predicted aconitase with swiveling domain